MRRILILTVLTAFGFSCTTPGKKTATGAAVGAAAGAAVGAAIGAQKGDAGKGALYGAAAGAVVGGAIGNILDKQAKELAKVAETRRTEEGILVNLSGDILFDTGKATLKQDAVMRLNQIGDIIAKYPEDRVLVVGHTDSVGSEAYNQNLSENRAKAVKIQLMSRGVPAEAITTVGMGESQPVASNETAEGRSRNRRVELKITIPQQ